MKYPIVKKAYGVNFDHIQEGYLAGEVVCHADSRNEAKNILLGKVSYDSWKLYYSDEELTYLNIPIRRVPSADICLFEGKELRLYQIERELAARTRMEGLEKLSQDDKVTHCYIIKRREYYGPNSCGYTSYKCYAGVYTKTEAISHAMGCEEITLEAINVAEHNDMINKQIQKAKNNLISEINTLEKSLIEI